MAKSPKPEPTLSKNLKDVDAAANYDSEEWFYDEKGYFLIRISQETRKIEVGHCRQNNVILEKFSGNNSKEVCQAVINAGLISRLDHAAYLGRETTKAETALRLNIPYVQDSDLEF
ncbi:DUF4346 domain-containing protein [Candidatus Woesearchaeota archaeon]|nr:DUF4346 domain-containing protein [Candidatus Woesearchaeota archaeon]